MKKGFHLGCNKNMPNYGEILRIICHLSRVFNIKNILITSFYLLLKSWYKAHIRFGSAPTIFKYKFQDYTNGRCLERLQRYTDGPAVDEAT